MQTPRFWFRAKPHGWGWDLPLTWQGWLAYLCALALHLSVFVVFPPLIRPVAFAACIFGIALAVVATCWVKGEPARWRL